MKPTLDTRQVLLWTIIKLGTWLQTWQCKKKNIFFQSLHHECCTYYLCPFSFLDYFPKKKGNNHWLLPCWDQAMLLVKDVINVWHLKLFTGWQKHATDQVPITRFIWDGGSTATMKYCCLPPALYRPPIIHTYSMYRTWSYLVTVTADAHKKVVWFDISVDEVLCVYIFNSADHLKIKRRPWLNISSFNI